MLNSETLLMERIDNYPKIIGSDYLYNGNIVPRVTEILSSMLHEDYLMKWSNSIGLYKHQKYEEVLENSSSIGSYTHNAIENFLTNNIILDIETIPIQYRYKVGNAFNSFLEWWDIVSKNNNVKVLMTETKLVCKYFGGTLDLLVEINGKIYLVDFKTSNHPSYKYFLQLSGYRYMLREVKGINVDGCIILMLDKTSYSFREMFLNFDDINHLSYINQCEETFLSLVYAYYQRLISVDMYNNIFGGKKNGICRD